jgi:hypothetical protein
LEDLEQQWQQQLQLGQALPQQQQQQVWDEGQQDAWFEQQVAQQRPRQCAAGEQGQGAPGAYRQLAEPLTDGCVTAAATRDRACVGGLVCNVLSRAAVDALRDMVHSCMDR